MINLLRRVERLEAAAGAHEVTLPELVSWSYAKPPFDADTQRRYDDFARRCEQSKLCRLIEETVNRNGEKAKAREHEEALKSS